MTNGMSMENIVTSLQKKSHQFPHHFAYSLLNEDLREITKIQYSELDKQAKKIAVYLQKQNLYGQRVLLVYPTGIEFIVNFMGCLYAGVIAVTIRSAENAE